MHLDSKPSIVLVGRTNVGKSTLFNRLSGTRDALVFDRKGVTRDTKEKEINIYGKYAVLIDSPGMFDYTECDNKPELMEAINDKLLAIIKSANIAILVLDGTTGITTNDRNAALMLRKLGKNVIVAVNKSEKKLAEHTYLDATELGFPDVVQISAEHGLGIQDLLDLVYNILPQQEISAEDTEPTQAEDTLKLAIIGRPNVGKSTMFNRLLGKQKQLVADFSGLTRESSSADFDFKGRKISIIDTPGLRRRSRISDILEKISATTSQKSYKSADAVILVIDAMTLESGVIDRQDIKLASDVISEGKALVIVFNKYDKTPYKKNDVPEFIKNNFSRSLSQLRDVPFLFTSAINNENIEKMLTIILSIYEKQKRKLKTSELNKWLSDLNKNNFLQSGASKFKLKYIVQIGTTPPSFLIFVTNKENMRSDHERFIINNLKSYFDFSDVAVKVTFKDQKTNRK